MKVLRKAPGLVITLDRGWVSFDHEDGWRLGWDDPRLEPVEYMARAALILATCAASELTGRICYSQPLLKKHGQL